MNQKSFVIKLYRELHNVNVANTLPENGTAPPKSNLSHLLVSKLNVRALL
jgi:hypothetical protein